MERDDVKKLLMTMCVDFPSVRIGDEQLSFTVNAWHRDLQEYSTAEVMEAYQIFKTTANSAFAPTTSQILGCMFKVHELAELSVSEAWTITRNAIGRSAYNSGEEFAKLPPAVQKAIGSAEQLHVWATDKDFNDSVVMALFVKNYEKILQRNNDEIRLPQATRERLAQIRNDNVQLLSTNTFLIGQKADKLQEGDFDYTEQQRPDNETIGHYAQQLREKLGG